MCDLEIATPASQVRMGTQGNVICKIPRAAVYQHQSLDEHWLSLKSNQNVGNRQIKSVYLEAKTTV